MEAVERFNAKWKADEEGCHIWQNAVSGLPGNQYGTFADGGKTWRAHRWLFLYAHDYLPPAVCHACDKPLCVREQCLFPGAHSDNMLDKAKKGRVRGGRPPTYRAVKIVGVSPGKSVK